MGGIAKLPLPSDGYVYTAGTRNFDRIRCKPNTANGFPGEGFIVKTAGGLIYTLDVGFARDAGVIEKGTGSWEDPTDTDKVGRIRVYLVASRIEDRFGNWVSYQWSGDKLVAITASDGRSISLAWTGPNVQSVTANSRTWHYSYTASGMRVTLPDSSYWEIDFAGSMTPGYFFGSGGEDCAEGAPPVGSQYAPQPRVTMRHPSGAVGTFEFDILRHRRNGIPFSACQSISTRGGTIVRQLVIPNYFDAYSIVKKTVSGPGVESQLWRYDYAIASGEFDYASYTPCTSCEQTKSTLVTAPDGVVTESVFGAVWSLNEGRLLAVHVRDGQGQQVRSETYEYMSDAQAAGSPFADMYGAATSGDDWVAHRIRPLVTTRIYQQSGTFTRTVEQFDQFARPLRVTRTGVVSP